MDAQSPGYFTQDELAALEGLFQRLRHWGSLELQYQAGHPVVAHLRLTFKPPLPRWVRLLAAAEPQTLSGRPP